MQTAIVREWLTYKEAEQLVGLSRTTLWRLVSDGEIQTRKVGRALRINRESLVDFMQRDAEGSSSHEQQ
jgi:excisionase family DNA binding protein